MFQPTAIILGAAKRSTVAWVMCVVVMCMVVRKGVDYSFARHIFDGQEANLCALGAHDIGRRTLQRLTIQLGLSGN